VVRAAAMFRGYWNDSVATAETIRNGWCHTGDIGRFDEEGLLHLVDRKKDVVISGGENVFCPEVEDAVTTHPAVAACAVIGVPDQRWGEAVCAVVVPEPGATVSTEDVQRQVRERLAGYKTPRRVVVVDALPLLATGKVDKKRLRARYAVAAAG
jgi:acyl-CoA synthetase (AMP-forming)/AMP-acid ligase II